MRCWLPIFDAPELSGLSDPRQGFPVRVGCDQLPELLLPEFEDCEPELLDPLLVDWLPLPDRSCVGCDQLPEPPLPEFEDCVPELFEPLLVEL
jgi:hypothetical protein